MKKTIFLLAFVLIGSHASGAKIVPIDYDTVVRVQVYDGTIFTSLTPLVNAPVDLMTIYPGLIRRSQRLMTDSNGIADFYIKFPPTNPNALGYAATVTNFRTPSGRIVNGQASGTTAIPTNPMQYLGLVAN